MFTGIVTDLGTIRSAERRGDLRLVIGCGYDMTGVDLGASISCSGCCLTVIDKGTDWFAVDASAETVSKTAAAMWLQGRTLNLERALKLGDELGGHLVTGHVDGIAEIITLETIAPDPSDPWGATARFSLRVPGDLAGYIAKKGSVALDGVSLTVNSVDHDRFSVLLIPHTLSVTTWGGLRAGDRLHVEVDLMARYAARLAEARAQGY